MGTVGCGFVFEDEFSNQVQKPRGLIHVLHNHEWIYFGFQVQGPERFLIPSLMPLDEDMPPSNKGLEPAVTKR